MRKSGRSELGGWSGVVWFDLEMEVCIGFLDEPNWEKNGLAEKVTTGLGPVQQPLSPARQRGTNRAAAPELN